MAVRLNLVPQREITNVSCSASDNVLRQWEFELFNGDSRWAIDADSVTLVCRGLEIPGTISQNQAVIEATAELTSLPGRHDAKLLFEKGSEKLYSAAFIIWVEDL
jgi:hypothetical protein